MKIPSPTFLYLAQKIVGATDLLTGILLIIAPAFTLKLMLISTSYTDTGLLSFIGAFVFAVGLSYFLVPARIRTVSDLAAWKMQWKISATIRLTIGIFITTMLIINSWHIGWISVAISDLTYAALQFIGIKNQWLDKTHTIESSS